MGNILRAHEAARRGFDPVQVRAEFPMLVEALESTTPTVYLDSAATTLKPRAVVEALTAAHAGELSSAGRAAHRWACRATEAYEGARSEVAHFIGARSDEVIFVRGTTDALNLVAECWARPRLGPGDEVLVTELEHHSNFLPWQRVAQQTGARLIVVPVSARGLLDLDAITTRLGGATRLVACAHVSNALGQELPVRELAAQVRARAPHAVLVVDGAQAIAHAFVDVAALGCDFYAFSAHKMYGPAGIGVLFGRREHLAAMPPYQVGGGMVSRVQQDGARFIDAPQRFEAGTPDVAGALGLAAAIRYLVGLDRGALQAHERALIAATGRRLRELPGVEVFGPASTALLSFALPRAHPHDVASVLDTRGIAVRAGHHCAQPLMRRLGVSGTVRASVGAYNTDSDVDALVDAVRHACELFR